MLEWLFGAMAVFVFLSLSNSDIAFCENIVYLIIK